MTKISTLILLFLIGFCVCFQSALANDAPLRAAIFVQNRAGEDVSGKVGVLNDMISTRLTERGFSIIDQHVVAIRFQETKDASDVSSVLKKSLIDLIQGKETKATVESTITEASALRIAQMIGADYLVFATINSIGQERREFKGEGTLYGTDNAVTLHTLRIALKVLDGGQGGSLYGDMVTVNARESGNKYLSVSSNDTLNKLLDLASVQIAQNIESKVERIRASKPEAPAGVQVTVKSNIEGSVVALDGAVLGESPGAFSLAPGLHQMRITKEFCLPWEKTVNLFDGQVLNITLELSDEGVARFKDIEKFKLEMAQQKQDMALEKRTVEVAIDIAREQSAAEVYSAKANVDMDKKRTDANVDIAREQSAAEVYSTKANVDMDKKRTDANVDIAREQSEADAYAKKEISEGEKKKREKSYIRSKGTNVINMIIYKGE